MSENVWIVLLNDADQIWSEFVKQYYDFKFSYNSINSDKIS